LHGSASAAIELERSLRDVSNALTKALDKKGKFVRRPLSPHLQIYRWPVTMLTSIMHRVTGCMVAVGTLLLTWWLVAAATSDEAFETVQRFIGSAVGLFCLFGWTVTLFYHFFNGIRHLAWDVGLGFEKSQYTLSSWSVLTATAVCSILVWVVGLAIW
jgi:succinate dehydrogenase / fumarate reductase cytochrome b subunit